MTITFERERVKTFVEFPGADLYGDPLDERFSITSPIEALERMLDKSLLPATQDVRAWLKQEAVFLEVAAFATETPVPGYHNNLVEEMRQWFGEDYGDDEGDDRLTDEQIKQLDAKAKELVDWYLSVAKVYRIEQLREWTFDSEDVLELVEKLRPDWLTNPVAEARSGDWTP